MSIRSKVTIFLLSGDCSVKFATVIAGKISAVCHIHNRRVCRWPMCPPPSEKWGATAGAVRPACDGPVMDDTMQLREIDFGM